MPTAELDITIDDGFRDLIRPLGPEERSRLEASIKAEGCRDPLVVWNGVLIDGHNRYSICTEHNIPFSVVHREFESREDAYNWMIHNQLARRNLTNDEMAYLWGKRYLAEKKSVGAPEGNENAKQSRQSDGVVSGETSERVGGELGVSSRTVERAASFAEAVDKIAGICGPEAKNLILSGELALTRDDVVAISKEDADTVKTAIEKAKKGAVEVAKAIRKQQKEKRRKKREADRHAKARKAKKIVGHEDQCVKFGSFRDVVKAVADESVALVFTDPPYDRKSLPMYADVAKEAARILKPGGSLICYLGQFQIHEVCQLVTPHLRLWWTLACIHSGQSARMTEYGIVVKWKPMLWFVKGTRGEKTTWVDDAVVSQQEKGTHDWQQSVVEASYYIERLTNPGDLVFDPFCGGGTTAIACKSIGRQWLTCDIDQDAVHLARQRIKEFKIEA